MTTIAAGLWTIKLTTPMGSQEGSLRIEENSGGLGGTISIPPLGDLALRDVQADENRLTWSVKAKAPLPITAKFTAAIDGDSIRGRMSSKLANGNFEGTRTVAS